MASLRYLIVLSRQVGNGFGSASMQRVCFGKYAMVLLRQVCYMTLQNLMLFRQVCNCLLSAYEMVLLRQVYKGFISASMQWLCPGNYVLCNFAVGKYAMSWADYEGFESNSKYHSKMSAGQSKITDYHYLQGLPIYKTTVFKEFTTFLVLLVLL